MDKIKTTHVGSLPRSNELSDLLFKKDKGENIDINLFDETVKTVSYTHLTLPTILLV